MLSARLLSQVRRFDHDGREIIPGAPITPYPSPERRRPFTKDDFYEYEFRYFDKVIRCSDSLLGKYFRTKKDFSIKDETYKWLTKKTKNSRINRGVPLGRIDSFYEDVKYLFNSNLEAITVL